MGTVLALRHFVVVTKGRMEIKRKLTLKKMLRDKWIKSKSKIQNESEHGTRLFGSFGTFTVTEH